MAKTLIAYFSHQGETYFPDGCRMVEKGNAQIIAEKASQIIKADVFRIETIKEYPIGYEECCNEAKREQDAGEFPELKEYLGSLSKYENLVVIYPCWWGTMPQAVFSFLRTYDLDNKHIYPICTHEGSGMGRSEKDLNRVCATDHVYNGLAIEGSKAEVCDEKLQEYLLKYVK